MRLQDITINMYYGMNKDFFFPLSLPYGSDTLVPPSHQYSCNSLPGPLYTCHPHSCLDSVCHSIVRTYRSFYSLCFRKKRNWKIDNFIFPTSRWRLRKKTLINFCSKFWSRILKASTTSKLMHKPYTCISLTEIPVYTPQNSKRKLGYLPPLIRIFENNWRWLQIHEKLHCEIWQSEQELDNFSLRRARGKLDQYHRYRESLPAVGLCWTEKLDSCEPFF